MGITFFYLTAGSNTFCQLKVERTLKINISKEYTTLGLYAKTFPKGVENP